MDKLRQFSGMVPPIRTAQEVTSSFLLNVDNTLENLRSFVRAKFQVASQGVDLSSIKVPTQGFSGPHASSQRAPHPQYMPTENAILQGFGTIQAAIRKPANGPRVTAGMGLNELTGEKAR